MQIDADSKGSVALDDIHYGLGVDGSASWVRRQPRNTQAIAALSP